MTTVTLSAQIARVTRRLATVEHCLGHCRHEERPAIELEKAEWEAVLATLCGIRSANIAAGIVEKSAAPQGAMPPAVTGDPLPSDQTALRWLP